MKNKIIFIRKILSLCFCLYIISDYAILKAQNAITLQAAIDTALKNNLTIKNEKLKSDYQKKMINSATNIPQTNVTGGYGQINSYYYDNSFGASQSFNFPTVYINQKHLLSEEWKTSLLNVALKETEIKKTVRQIFYMLIYLKQKKQLLSRNDSIYSAFLEKSNLRFSKGEANVLEKTTAETQRGNIAIQLKQLQMDLEVIQWQFMLILNSNTIFVPSESNPKLEADVTLDTNISVNHPYIKIIEQQRKISTLNQKIEKSKLFPDFNIGYYNMTMKGSGADNIVYNSTARFQSLQLGVGIPLFFGAQKAKISALKINTNVMENNYLQEKLALQNQYQKAINQYQVHLNTVSYFEKTALKNSILISEAADKQYNNGEINYLDWVMLTNQSINIQSDYLDAVKNLNEAIIQINYLTSK